MKRSEKIEKLRDLGLRLKDLAIMDDSTLEQRYKAMVYGVSHDDMRSFFKVFKALSGGKVAGYVEVGNNGYDLTNENHIRNLIKHIGLD